MLIILGSRYDNTAKKLAKRWASRGCRLLACEDLSRSGWRHYVGNIAKSRSVAAGRIMPTESVTGVLTLRPSIFKEELFYVHEKDRAYMAAEMTAFLTCWLASLSCPILNAPTASCLAGPGWREEEWVQAAARAGFSIKPTSYKLRYAPNEKKAAAKTKSAPNNLLTVTLVGKQNLGAKNPALVKAARKLAMLASTDYLSVSVRKTPTGHIFESANPWPDCSRSDIVKAISTYFFSRPSRRRKM